MTVGFKRCVFGSLAAVVLAANVASAQAPTPAPTPAPTTPADEAFKQGRELMKVEKYAKACEQFQTSQQLDPQLGTLFNIAQCSEKIGKLATALAAYREVLAKDTNDKRKGAATAQIDTLVPRVPKLIVKIENPPTALTVELNSKAGARPIDPNKPVEIDFGDYTIVARARGFSEFMSKIKVNVEGTTMMIDAVLVPGASNTETVLPPEDSGGKPPAGSRRKLFAIGVLTIGGAALIGGGVVGVLARSAWNDAKALCGGTSCSTQAEVDLANDAAKSARSKATMSTALMIGGAMFAAAGIALWVTAPGDVQVTPQASDSGAGVSFAGRF